MAMPVTATSEWAPSGIKSSLIEIEVTDATYMDDLGRDVLHMHVEEIQNGTYVYVKVSSNVGRVTYFDVSENDGLDEEYSGTYDFTFTSATEGTFVDKYTGPYNGTNSGTFKILSFDATTRPVAKSKTVKVKPNKKKRFRLKGTGMDYPKSTLRYKIIKKPRVGKLVLKNLPKVIYKPKPGFTGKVKFRYIVKEGKTKSKTATVTLKVVKGKMQ